MKHLFLINPCAGKKDCTAELSEAIRSKFDQTGEDYEIMISKQAGDITRYAREAAETGEELRIYACGGDGTLNEAVNGIIGHKNAALTHLPYGTGNDFIKIFSDPSKFRDLDAYTDSSEAVLDAIQCGDKYAINICSVGFDAKIAQGGAKYKRIPLITGFGAYVLSVIENVIRGFTENYEISWDGNTSTGLRTMITVCSGRYYGGGFNPIPEAEPDDGILDVLLVKPITRLQVAKMIGPFKNGLYAQFPEFFSRVSVKEITVKSKNDITVNIDGECSVSKEFSFKIVPGAIRFFYPSCLTYHHN